MGLERVPSLPFLLRQVRVGVVATGLTVAALGVSYFGLERAPFHRVGLAIVLVIAAAGGACIAVLPWARLFETTGMRFLYVWSVPDIVLISFAVAATGGGRSDLFLLYTLTTFFFVASYPPIAQLALLIFTAASYTAVMILTGWQITAGALVARLSILAVLAYLAGYLSKELLDRVQSEAAARQEADERAAFMSGVVKAGRDMTLDPSQVVEVALNAVGGLGFGDAAFVALREDGSVSQVVESRGRFDDDGPASSDPALDVIDLVVAQGEGPGISAADLPYLGARFFRGGDVNARPKGLGLGLAFATSALELHGAVLEVESAEGRGSRFAFRLSPLGASGEAPVNGEVVHERA